MTSASVSGEISSHNCLFVSMSLHLYVDLVVHWVQVFPPKRYQLVISTKNAIVNNKIDLPTPPTIISFSYCAALFNTMEMEEIIQWACRKKLPETLVSIHDFIYWTSWWFDLDDKKKRVNDVVLDGVTAEHSSCQFIRIFWTKEQKDLFGMMCLLCRSTFLSHTEVKPCSFFPLNKASEIFTIGIKKLKN